MKHGACEDARVEEAPRLWVTLAGAVLHAIVLAIPAVLARGSLDVQRGVLVAVLALGGAGEGLAQRGRRVVRDAPGVAWGGALSCAALLACHVGAVAAPGARGWLAAGLATTGAGFALRAAAVRALGEHFHASARVDLGQGLRTRGVYALVRHPAELGLLLLGAGPAMATGSWAAGLMWAGVLAPLVVRRVVGEDRVLGAAFGGAHRAYAERTGMLVPGLRG